MKALSLETHQAKNCDKYKLATTKWIYHKERSFASGYFIFLKVLFPFKNLLSFFGCLRPDTTIYTVSEKKKESVIRALETSSSLLFGWFNNNFMKANSDKSHLIMSCAEATTAVIDGLPIDCSKTEVLLGITIDYELKFDDHVNLLCKKASLKLNALARIAPFMNVSKKRIIMKSFIESQFAYCPLIWMFRSR